MRLVIGDENLVGVGHGRFFGGPAPRLEHQLDCPPMHTDRRAFLRVMAEFPVGVTRLDAGTGAEAAFAATTVNICAGGAKMVAPTGVTAGERLRLEVRFAK